MRSIHVIDSLPMSGRTLYLVDMRGDTKPYEIGEVVAMDGKPMRVIGRESQPMVEPRYIINGHMGLVLTPVVD